jgi:hypothetical protein
MALSLLNYFVFDVRVRYKREREKERKRGGYSVARKGIDGRGVRVAIILLLHVPVAEFSFWS